MSENKIREFERFCQKNWGEYFHKQQTTLPEEKIFYHFTTFEGLKGILETKKLWATHYNYLNDFSEIKLAHDICFSLIKKQYKNEKKINFLEAAFENALNKSKIYTISFCRLANIDEKDHLPMWRYYANDAAGFALGFDSSMFISNDTEDVSDEDPGWWTQSMVEYFSPGKIVKLTSSYT